MIKCPNCGNTKRIALSATDGKAYCTVYHLEGTGCGYAGPKTEFQEPEITGYRKLPEGESSMSTPSSIARIAQVCHEANRTYCETLGDHSQPAWDDAPTWQWVSAIAGVMHTIENPDSTPADSHDSWLEQKIAAGWVWGPEKDPEQKTHPCILPYDKLPAEQKMKDILFQAIVRSFL